MGFTEIRKNSFKNVFKEIVIKKFMLITNQEFKILIEKYKNEGLKKNQIKERIKELLSEVKDSHELIKFKKLANII